MSRADEIRRELTQLALVYRDLQDRPDPREAEKAARVLAGIRRLEAELRALEVGRRVDAGQPEPRAEQATLDRTIDELNRKLLYERYSETYSSRFCFRRKGLQEQLQKFLDSDCTVMVVTGKAGTGKSVFVCDLLEHPPPGCLVWICDTESLDTTSARLIDVQLGLALGSPSGALVALSTYMEAHDSTCAILLFDSVNEHPAREELLGRLSVFVRRIADPRVRIVVTCRQPAWETIGRHFRIPLDRGYHETRPGSWVSLDVFDQEEARLAYEQYRQAYDVKTPYSAFSTNVRNLLAHPLFLRMAMQGHRGDTIPPRSLALADVFSKYVENCLGADGYNSSEYDLLQRLIRLMYERARARLELSILAQNGAVGAHTVPDIGSPYGRLVGEGLLSEERRVTFLAPVRLVYVTYEMVFEYLLAQIVVGDVSADEVIRNLELARAKSFAPLRGAAVLALGFAVLSSRASDHLMTAIARADQPGSRQFLCDVIQTIYDSGNRAQAESIVRAMSKKEGLACRLLAIQAACHLGMDDLLVSLALSSDESVREAAVVGLYERWDEARHRGQIDRAYSILNKLSSHINILGVASARRSRSALQSLLSLAAYVLVHLVDDPDSVQPLLEVFSSLANRVPGIRLGIQGDSPNRPAGVVTEIVAKAISTIGGLDSQLDEAIGQDATIRAIVDVGELMSLDSLGSHVEELISLATWDNAFVRFITSALETRPRRGLLDADRHSR